MAAIDKSVRSLIRDASGVAPVSTNSEKGSGWFERAKDGATLAALVFSAISLLLATRSLRVSQRSLKAKVSLDALQLLEGKDGRTRDNRLLLESLVKTLEDKNDLLDLRYRDKETRDRLHELARAYDMAGLLVKHGLIPISLLFDFYSRPIALAWKHLGAWVKQEGLEKSSSAWPYG